MATETETPSKNGSGFNRVSRSPAELVWFKQGRIAWLKEQLDGFRCDELWVKRHEYLRLQKINVAIQAPVPVEQPRELVRQRRGKAKIDDEETNVQGLSKVKKKKSGTTLSVGGPRKVGSNQMPTGGPSYIFISSESESDDDVTVKKNRLVEVNIIQQNGCCYYMWEKKVVCGKTAMTNVFQLPQKVIQLCIPNGQSSIKLYDADKKKSYHGVLHFAKREYGVDRYLGKGWYEFARDRKLKKGDVMTFLIVDPPAKKIVVRVSK